MKKVLLTENEFQKVKHLLNERHNKDYFNVTYVDYELTEDDYKDGYGKMESSWDDRPHKSYGSFKELIEKIEDYINLPSGVEIKPSDLFVSYGDEDDGSFRIQFSALVKVNNDYYETMEVPSEGELKSWRMGKKKLYALDITVKVESNFELDELVEAGKEIGVVDIE